MQHTLITGRPASGKTTKAIDIFSSNENGLFFTREMSKDQLLKRLNETYSQVVFDDCQNEVEIVQKIKDFDKNINFIIVDYLQVFNSLDIKELLYFLDSKNIKLILLSYINKAENIPNANCTNDIKNLFNNTIRISGI